MAKVKYGIAEYSRWAGSIDYLVKTPMDGVTCGNLYEFFESAGENGWELCAAFPSGTVGRNVAQPNGLPDHKTTDASEYITMVFKKV